MTSGAFSAWGAILAGGECYTEVKMILKYFFLDFTFVIGLR